LPDKESGSKGDIKETRKQMEKIVSLAKRRGFIFQSSEIYGGLNGCYDYGPLGVGLLNNIKEQWWKSMTFREDVEGLDASILMHPRVWEASGHVEHFTDPMVDCRQCKARYRLDDIPAEKTIAKTDDAILREIAVTLKSKDEKRYRPGTDEVADLISDLAAGKDVKENKLLLAQDIGVIGELVERGMLVCPNCGTKSSFTSARKFNLMFKTFVGPVEDSSAVVYLRPETAQGIYVNFFNVQSSSRQKVPFGIAQIGKAFRNEINTKNFLFRTREFEQMEMQFFVRPGDDEKWFVYWKEQRLNWFTDLGMKPDRLRFKEHGPDELAHYAKAAFDIQFEFPFGWGEIEGIHNRTDYDLRRHEEYSGKAMMYFDPDANEKYMPYVIETSAGASRSFMAFLINAFHEEKVENEMRTVLRLHPKLAPITAAVFPLVNRDGMPGKARIIVQDLQKRFKVFYDDKGAVGRRYRRQDEAGTPFCITIDSQTLEDDTVTIRERDSMRQIRISDSQVGTYLANQLVN
jgi:glycyl-tRNA synthetase